MITYFISSIKKYLRKHFLFVKGKKFDLIIIDDLLPVALSPWRNYEFDCLLDQYPNSKVILEFGSYLGMQGKKSYAEHLEELSKMYPKLANKLVPIKVGTSINSKLVYTLFYNNIRKYYPHLKSKNINYCFTLYPGGGFRLGEKICDDDLKTIINDELCKFVIVTQELTYKYLVNNLGVNKNNLFFIYGVPLSLNGNEKYLSNDRKYFNGKKDKIDIVFIAHKYTIFGLDKGFDIFQNTILELMDDLNFNFHVVGNFQETDLLYPELINRIKFHGLINEESFEIFFEDKDIVISPNRPNIIGNGTFDGFPLGSSMAAGFNNCVMLLTNAFDESKEIFIDNIHYLKIKTSHKDVVNKLVELKNNKEKMKSLAEEGRNKILSTYYSKTQIEERIKIFNKYI